LNECKEALAAYQQSTNLVSTNSNNSDFSYEKPDNLVSNDINSNDSKDDDDSYAESCYGDLHPFEEAVYPYKDVVISYQHFIEHENFDGDTERAFDKIGNLLYKLKLYKEALAVYRRAYKLSASSLYEMGCILFNSRHYEEALLAFKKSINLDIRNADAWRKKGDILKLLNRPDASFIHYEAAKIVASWNGTIIELENVISQLATAYTKNII
jgi:tetratricopeptide (TPR) repeat protein